MTLEALVEHAGQVADEELRRAAGRLKDAAPDAARAVEETAHAVAEAIVRMLAERLGPDAVVRTD